MSTLNIDDTLTAPPPHSTPVRSVSDVARLINSNSEKNSYARWIVFLALGGVFLDALLWYR